MLFFSSQPLSYGVKENAEVKPWRPVAGVPDVCFYASFHLCLTGCAADCRCGEEAWFCLAAKSHVLPQCLVISVALGGCDRR